jgi:hypothetical protein
LHVGLSSLIRALGGGADLSCMLLFPARSVSVRVDLVRVRASSSGMCLLDPWRGVVRIGLNLRLLTPRSVTLKFVNVLCGSEMRFKGLDVLDDIELLAGTSRSTQI